MKLFLKQNVKFYMIIQSYGKFESRQTHNIASLCWTEYF